MYILYNFVEDEEQPDFKLIAASDNLAKLEDVKTKLEAAGQEHARRVKKLYDERLGMIKCLENVARQYLNDNRHAIRLDALGLGFAADKYPAGHVDRFIDQFLTFGGFCHIFLDGPERSERIERILDTSKLTVEPPHFKLSDLPAEDHYYEGNLHIEEVEVI